LPGERTKPTGSQTKSVRKHHWILIAQKYLVPTVRAAVKLQQHDPDAAIDLLRGTAQYDLAFTMSFDYLYPAYSRGLAYLESGDGRSAAGEFQ
jgi:hypothetical protein